jgi:DNA-binding FrmR family transcriptional regulator
MVLGETCQLLALRTAVCALYAAVLQQIAAIQGAVNGMMAEVLEGHIREHPGPEAVSPKERRLEQVVDVLRSYLK